MELLTAILAGSVGAAIVGGIFSVIMFKLNRKAEKEDKQESKEDDLTSGLRILLYDRIKHLGKSYITRGYITTEELEDLLLMHKIYHDNLKGNGFLDSLMGQVKQLPIHD